MIHLTLHCSGFVEEGRQRKAIWRNGGWKDVIIMGLLIDDWAKSHNLEQ